jgi:hypothetical protein
MDIKTLSEKVARLDKKLAELAPGRFKKGRLVKSSAKLAVKLREAPARTASRHAALLGRHFDDIAATLETKGLARKDVYLLGAAVSHHLNVAPGLPVKAMALYGTSTTDLPLPPSSGRKKFLVSDPTTDLPLGAAKRGHAPPTKPHRKKPAKRR